MATPQIPQLPDTRGGKFGRHSNELGCIGLGLLLLLLIVALAVVLFVWR